MTENQKKIAVIGAGIMGLSVAYALIRAGHKIILFEKSDLPADNASWKAGGMLAPYSEIEHMPQKWVEAGLDGISFWSGFAKEYDIDFHQTGSFFIAHKEDHYILERFKNHLPQDKKDTQPTEQLEPLLAERFEEGLFLKEEAYLNPQKAMQALLKACEDRDIVIKQDMVEPESLRDSYDFVIDCRGYGGKRDLDGLRGVKGEIALVHNPEFSLSRPVRLMHPRYPLYIVPREDHHFMIGATMIEAADEAHVSVRSGLELMSALYSLHPSFGDAQIVKMRAGIRPAFEDNLPRIDQEGTIIHCNGLFRHGYLLAPIMAHCVLDRISDKDSLYMSLVTGEKNESQHKREDRDLRGAA